MNKICIIGAGYVGIPTAILLASKNNSVNLVDINAEKIKDLKKGNLFIKEKNLIKLFKNKIIKKYITFSSKPKKADIYFFCVPSDLNTKKRQNKKPLWMAVKSIKNLLKKDDLIIIETTSEVGITQEIINYFKKCRHDLFDKKNNIFFNIAYCPERVFPGNILSELQNNYRVIGGYNINSSKRAKKIFNIFSKKNITIDHKSAELIKLVENSYRNLNISFSNEISMLCERLDLDFNKIRKLINYHPRVNLLNAGIGVGGHCIPIDPYFLVSKYKNLKVVSEGILTNKLKTKWVCQKILKNIRQNPKKNLLVWGLTYKANVNDIRESPSIEIINYLINKKYKVKVVDFNVNSLPKNIGHKLKLINKPSNFIKKSLNIILVNHKNFNKYKSKIKKSKFIDMCNFF